MLLEPLVSTIETIKGRIATHGASLRQNETRTRAALIDPLLTALGWDSFPTPRWLLQSIEWRWVGQTTLYLEWETSQSRS